jgi:tRNA A37 threonylcarbamoyladenosine synthetase subunit TsaC/SUA5/YrdC
VRELGHPLLTTSAPKIEGVHPNDAHELARALKREVGTAIDGGVVPGEPSTVIDLSTDEVRILRVGCGDVTFLEAA